MMVVLMPARARKNAQTGPAIPAPLIRTVGLDIVEVQDERSEMNRDEERMKGVAGRKDQGSMLRI